MKNLLILLVLVVAGCEANSMSSESAPQKPVDNTLPLDGTKYEVKKIVRVGDRCAHVIYYSVARKIRTVYYLADAGFNPSFIEDVPKDQPCYLIFDGDKIKEVHIHGIEEIQEGIQNEQR